MRHGGEGGGQGVYIELMIIDYIIILLIIYNPFPLICLTFDLAGVSQIQKCVLISRCDWPISRPEFSNLAIWSMVDFKQSKFAGFPSTNKIGNTWTGFKSTKDTSIGQSESPEDLAKGIPSQLNESFRTLRSLTEEAG